MKKIEFYKMSGAGNDFVLLYGKKYSALNLKKIARKLCSRGVSIGADGLLYVSKISKETIGMRYFNADGSEAFCGNGARCCVWWASSNGIIKKKKFKLESIKGSLNAEIIAKEKVKVEMPDVYDVKLNYRGSYPPAVKKLHFLNTGAPHAIVSIKNLEVLDVDSMGKLIRHNKAFGKYGTNVDFVSLKGGKIFVRTYERGVEAETLACGTGITASAIAMSLSKKNIKQPVICIATGGEEFKVWFDCKKQNQVSNIYLQGPAKQVFKGEI
ncbi:MAG: diaminopimelate epimerase [Elusimicrobiota bacterium]|nr:diaminopimelate epimerase [Elusimicrobiota bacterium]